MFDIDWSIGVVVIHSIIDVFLVSSIASRGEVMGTNTINVNRVEMKKKKSVSSIHT